MSLSRKLNQTVEVLRAEPVRSATGAVAHTPPAEASHTYPGRLESAKGRRLLGADGVFHEADAVVYLPGGADARPPDTDDAQGEADWLRVNGALYRVVHAHDVAGSGRLTRCLVKRVK